jgi:DNA-binding NtrC family response regulator
MAKILLVDDDVILADELKATLERRGHDVVTASNGVNGLRQFEEARFDCVISDIIMPDMEGIGMMLEMRRRIPSAKIVMMSGGGLTGRDDFLRAAAKLGAVVTMRKPINPDDLLRVLDGCLATGNR